MAFVTRHQPAGDSRHDWTACLTLVWQLEWTNQCNYIGENKKSDSCLATFENSDNSSGDYCATLFNLVYKEMYISFPVSYWGFLSIITYLFYLFILFILFIILFIYLIYLFILFIYFFIFLFIYLIYLFYLFILLFYLFQYIYI